MSDKRPKTTHEIRGGVAGAFRSRCEAARCPGTERTPQDDGNAAGKRRKKHGESVSRPDVDSTLTATRDDAAMPDAVRSCRCRAVAAPPADDAHAASNPD